MTKAAAKITTKANPDHNLIALGRQILKLRKEQIETGSNVVKDRGNPLKSQQMRAPVRAHHHSGRLVSPEAGLQRNG